MIKLYRKKPVVIEALLYTGHNSYDVNEFTRGEASNYTESQCTIHTLEGDMIASVGDYIIKGVKGEFYPCKPDIFFQTYEEVE